MDKLRLPFFVAALVAAGLVVLVEVGSPLLLKAKANAQELQVELGKPEYADLDKTQLRNLNAEAPPGLGLPCLALLDGLLAFTALLMGLPFLLSDRLQGRLVGITSVIVSFLVFLACLLLIFITLAKVLLMIGLFTAFPFGTAAYMAIWGFFDRAAATASLGLLLFLKLVFGGCLLLAQQRFLQNKGLLLIFATSLLANFVISFLHALVPRPLVSITDGVAAIIVLILAAIWALCMLVFGIISVLKAIV